MLGLIVSSLNIEYLMADILEESRNLAIEAYRAAYIANSSNSTPNSNSNLSKKGKNKKKASFILGSYNLAMEEEEEESDSSSNSMEIPSNSIRKEDYRPIIEDAIVSEAIEPKKRYKLRNFPAKGTILEGFIKDNTVLSQPTNNIALERELVDLDLDLEGAVSPDPSNLNTKKPISIEIGPSKLEPYESSSDSKLDKPLPDKPINPVIVESTRPTISIRQRFFLPEAFPKTREPIFTPKPIKFIAPNVPLTNEPLDNSDLILEGDKIQLDYYKLLAKTSSYILSLVYKARERVIFKDSTPTTYKQVLKLPRDKHSQWLKAITKEFIQLLEQGVFKFLSKSLLPSNYKLITCRNVLKVNKDAKNRPIKSLNRPTKSHLNAAKNPFKYLNSTKDYSIYFSYNGNTVADLGPKFSNSSNTTTKLSRDFHFKEGPRPLTTTSTTIVDSRNGKGSSRTSIINSSLVPIGFSDSDFAGDKATSKSTYGYLYKLAALYARTEHTLLKFRYVREQVKAKIVTIIYLNTKYMPADGLTKARAVSGF
ncbi:hypothetical protein P8C59_009616 [Phyllachora maydis]|uniref:Uncharacterized protein n=1 Tax=Phyllachora maydis TaxID=1825666 RepID=A0AAD9MFT9_9PEZI|nr:hypothetical protein P8C59_009616 [Phyllachora maydis]